MALKDRLIVVCEPDAIRYVYTDGRKSITGGARVVVRASHVEPDGDRWAADLGPSGGPVLRGFRSRSAALRAEVRWLHSHNLGNQGGA